MTKKYFVRYKLSKSGIEEIRVPRKKVTKKIDEFLKKDKEMLKILEKL